MKKDIFLVSLGLGTTAILGFIYTVLMARILSPDQFGVFSALVSLIAITFSLGDLGVGPAIINFLPKHKDKTQEIVETGYWFEYLVGFATIVFFGMVSFNSHLIIPGSVNQQFFLVGSISFNYLLIGFSQAIFTANRQFQRFSSSQIIDAVIKIVLVLAFLRLGRLSISSALVANFISTFFALILTFWNHLWKIKLNFNQKVFSQLFHYSKWIAISRFFSVFVGRIDIILLNLMASSFQAGIFAAASRVTLIFALLVSSLGTVINPRFSGFVSKSEAKSYILKLFLLVSFLSAFVLLSVGFSDQIILLVFGSRYLASSPLFKYLGLSMIPFLFTVITTGALLYTFNQSKYYAKIVAIQVTLIVLIDFFFIPRIGAHAPVLASFVANIFFLGASITKLYQLFASHHPLTPSTNFN